MSSQGVRAGACLELLLWHVADEAAADLPRLWLADVNLLNKEFLSLRVLPCLYGARPI